MRRALTLIETLVALSLLSGVLLVAASWTGSSAQSLASASARTNRALATEAVFRLITTDLSTGDFEPVQKGTRSRRAEETELVEVRDGALVIRTRDHSGAGGVLNHYRAELSSGELVRETVHAGDSSGPIRVLVDDVRTLDVSLDDEAKILRIALEFRDGDRADREMRVP